MARPDKKEKGATQKKSKGKKRLQKKWEAYVIDGDSITRKSKSCPKCGEGVHLAKHENRLSCGKCGYTEFTKKA
jgi:ubiquitin-small subunit ribosomal protein S27Ae